MSIASSPSLDSWADSGDLQARLQRFAFLYQAIRQTAAIQCYTQYTKLPLSGALKVFIITTTMTIRNITAFTLAFAFVFAGASTANAQSATSTLKGNSTSSAATAKEKETGNSTSTAAKAKEAATTTEAKGNATSTAAKAKESANGEDHRSAVATFVKTLLSQADRLGGIGQEVRAIANEQASSSEKISAAIDKVSKRNGFLTFLVGSDYESIGEIKKEIGATEVRIAKLQADLAGVEGTAAETAIQAEITALQEELAKVKAFVDENDSVFSLFGWLRK